MGGGKNQTLNNNKNLGLVEYRLLAGGIRFVGGPSEVKGRNKVAAVNRLSNFKCKLKYWSRWPPACSRYSEQRRAAFTMHLHIKWPRPNNTPTHRSTPVELHGISRASLRSTLSHPYSSFRYRAKKKKVKRKKKTRYRRLKF